MTEAVLGATTTGAGAGVLFIVYAALIVLVFVGWVKILRKAGYSGWWSLLIIVPLVNIVMFLVFAFGDWPSLRGQRAGGGDPPYPPYPGYPPVGWNPGQASGASWPPGPQSPPTGAPSWPQSGTGWSAPTGDPSQAMGGERAGGQPGQPPSQGSSGGS